VSKAFPAAVRIYLHRPVGVEGRHRRPAAGGALDDALQLAELRRVVGGEADALRTGQRNADARALVNGREAQQTLVNAAAAMAELRTVVARLPNTVATLDGSLRNVRGATTDLQAELGPILRDLRVAIANLRDTTEQLRRYPSQAILGAPPPVPEPRR